MVECLFDDELTRCCS